MTASAENLEFTTNASGDSRKLGAAIVRRIEADIMRRGWPVGEVIGTFAELIAHYSASRAVIREAIALLEHKQIVRMKHGPGGGVQISEPVSTAAAGALAGYFDFIGVSDAELLEVRCALLALATRRATERVDAAGIAKLRAAVDREAQIEPGGSRSAKRYLPFYSVVTALADNPAIDLLTVALTRRRVDQIASMAFPDEVLDSLHKRHVALVAAIATGDAEAAEARMREHQVEHSRLWNVMAAAADPQIARPASPAEAIANDRHGKLPVRVARWIRQEILDKGLATGDVVGFEKCLLEDLGVSRSVFREAVRIVEYYGLAEMRRGPKGGLTVCEPEPKYMQETISSYLDFMRLDAGSLLDIRVALEGENLEWAMERSGAGVGALEVIVAGELESEDPERMLDFHEALSTLSRNRAAGFIANVLARSSEFGCGSHAPDGSTANDPHSARRDDHLGHRRVVEAMAAGNTPLARQRLAQHLEPTEFPTQIAASR